MIINEDIPGWSSVTKLNTLAEYASQVKKGGLIVEVGSFCGRSAYALGMNKDDSVRLLCVDMFPQIWMYTTKVKDYPGTDSCYGDTDQIYSLETFERHTEDVYNLHTAQMTLPYNDKFFTFTEEIDLLFIDASHTYEAVSADIKQWCKYLADDGVVIFDDYFDLFPGCIEAVNEYVNSSNKSLSIIDGTAALVTSKKL